MSKAIELYGYAARKNYIPAQKKLGKIYSLGGDEANEIKSDFEQSAKWYLKAAKKGDMESQYEYGYCCYWGSGRVQSFPEAYDWLSLAAEQGCHKAMFYLGELYRNGEGVSKNYRTAAKWYRKSAKAGMTYASMNIGRLYREGKGVKKDLALADLWISYGCTNGESATHMGYMYEFGITFNQSMEDAVWWYRLSADQGDPNGQCNLGNLYC